MKNRIIRNWLPAALVFAAVIAAMGSCRQDDSGDSVVLNVFGPSPVIRGGEISFIGQNLGRVTEIVLPTDVSVTDIEKVSATTIKITVPMNAEEGYVTLKYPGGQITTKTMIRYTEPVSLTSIAGPAEQVRAGDVITIGGAYLNNVTSVVFSVNAVVDSEDFISQSRDGITLALPGDAQSGPVYVTDTGDNVYYFDDEIRVFQPVVTAVSPLDPRPGGVLTVSGTDLNMITGVVFPDDITVSARDFLTQSATGITVTVPDDAKDGVLSVQTAGGAVIPTGNTLTMPQPTVTGTNAPDGYKAGRPMTVTGTNLDLVDKVYFSNEAEASFTVVSATELTVEAIPGKAVDGAVTVVTKADKSAVSAAVTLVKPTVTGIDPTGLTAGNDVTITGTDLDLVTKIVLGDVACPKKTGTETELVVTIPVGTGSGTFTLTLANGTTVADDTPVTVAPATNPAVTEMPGSADSGDEITLAGANLNYVESIWFEDVKVTQYGDRSAASITLTVPETAPKGTYALKMVTYDGQSFYTPEISVNMGVVIDPLYVYFDFNTEGKKIGWKDFSGGEADDPANSADNTAFYKFEGTIDNPSAWGNYFAQGYNNTNYFYAEGVTAEGWSLAFQANVQVSGELYLKWRLGNYWYAWKVPATDGWQTFVVPLTAFRDADGNGTNSVTLETLQNVETERALTSGWGEAGTTLRLFIDNVGFVPNP